MNLGDIRLGDTVDFHFTTRQSTGAPTSLLGTPVLSAYPANSATQLTAGITLDVDFDTVTGLNHVRVVASGANGYLTATDYSLVITTGTVNAVSVVGEVVATFSIEHRSALMPATAARTLVVDGSGLADANMVKSGPSGSGTAQTARDLGANLDTTVSSRSATGDAMALTATERNAVADAWTARNVAGGSVGGRTNGQALAVLRNRIEVNNGILTVYGADDVSVLWTGVVTTAPGNPISSIDPA